MFKIKNKMNYVVKKIMSNSYTKKKANLILILLCSTVLRNLLYFITYYMIRAGNDILDFIISIVITIILTTKTNFLEAFVENYQHLLQPITNYFIDNYSTEKMKIWNRYFIWISGSISIIFLYIVKVTSMWFIQSIVHFIICCLILDKIEDWNKYSSWSGYLHSWFNQKLNKPIINQYHPFPKIHGANKNYQPIDIQNSNSIRFDPTQIDLNDNPQSLFNIPPNETNADIHSKIKTMTNVEYINPVKLDKINFNNYP